MMIISKEQSYYIDHLRGLKQFRYRTKENRQGILRWVMGFELMQKGSIDNKTHCKQFMQSWRGG